MNISKFGTATKQPSSSVEVENKLSKTGDIMYGDLNLNNHKITNLATPVAESDSVNKAFLNNFIQVDNRRVFGSRLITLGLDSNGQHIASYSPINV